MSVGFLGFGILAPAFLVTVYGVGSGLSSIANGTVPLALFGQDQYARIMGRIALPSLLAQSAAPIVGSVLIHSLGHRNTLISLGLLAFVAFLLAIWMLLLHQGNRRTQEHSVQQGPSNSMFPPPKAEIPESPKGAYL